MLSLAHRLLYRDLSWLGRNFLSYHSHKRLVAVTPQALVSTYNGQERIGFANKFVLAAPLKIQPYLRLSRIDAPIGTWLLFWPCTWGLSLGVQGLPSLDLLGLFGLGAFLMRGAGCTINDMWDRRIDAAVSRTKTRPLASKQLRLRDAAGWMGLQLSLSFLILMYLPPPCVSLGFASLGLVVLYPLAKRVTNWPQGVLGLTFNTGILIGYTAAVGGGLGYSAVPWLTTSVVSMYGAAIAWTLLYDTVYAHQDREEDGYLGLGSTARRFGDNTKQWLTGFGAIMMSGLVASGWFSELSWPYYLAVSTVAAHLCWQISTLDINSRSNCASRFKANRHIGWIICAGILGSHFIGS